MGRNEHPPAGEKQRESAPRLHRALPCHVIARSTSLLPSSPPHLVPARCKWLHFSVSQSVRGLDQPGPARPSPAQPRPPTGRPHAYQHRVSPIPRPRFVPGPGLQIRSTVMPAVGDTLNPAFRLHPLALSYQLTHSLTHSLTLSLSLSLILYSLENLHTYITLRRPGPQSRRWPRFWPGPHLVARPCPETLHI